MHKFCFFICIVFIPVSTFAQISPEALKQWEDRKYSMFIHWGIYAELGGMWDGKKVTRGLSEQIQAHAGIYSDTYAQVAKRFNPVKWNPDSVVLLAKRAGMHSIVITSKHHDGFCMFHSEYTDFNVVDATPYKRDVLKELSEACARHNMKFGLYFSLIDWHYPQASPISSHNSDYITPEHFEFNKKQIGELLTGYGPISELWFDMGSQSFEQSLEMRKWVHSIQPDCMIGSRLGNDMSDFMVMGDNQEPSYIIGVPWQSPASFFHETWGYRSWQERGSVTNKTREKLTSLIRVCSRGGNYLLNIGPRGDGSVVEFEKEVLLNIGNWLEKNGEAIYGTLPDPFHVPFEWGSITTKNNKLFLHVLNRPEGDNILLPGLKGDIEQVSVLGEHISCSYQKKDKGISIELPASVDPGKEIKVIEIAFNGTYEVPPINIIPYSKGMELNQHNAFKYYSNSGIDYNSRYRSTIKEEWTINPAKKVKSIPVLYYTDEEKGKAIDLQLGDQTFTVRLDDGEQVKLNSNITGLAWGPIYLQGPLWSGIDGLHGEKDNIDLAVPWGNTGKMWERTNWKNNEIYVQPGGLRQAWYLLQEITSPKDQQILVSVTSSDGIMVLLNGRTEMLHNNPYKKEYMQDLVLLNLKEGKNQLLVKCFNNFQKEAQMGIGNHVSQYLYVKKLAPVVLRKGKYFPISWKLSEPVTPHETLNLPNLVLKFE
ncbi:MAG: alpha-L-fucosidase [Bacteroidales bacterium]|jgi:alpha-L-fucosidase|nr:alpha-L-fucosidase [Bacteroidales bacterium]